MTTQDTQHDHSDVDATVVEHPSAPEAPVDSSASETTTPTEVEEQGNPSSVEPVPPVPPVADEVHEKPTEASDEPAASPSLEQPQATAEPAQEVTDEAPANRSTEEEETAQSVPTETSPVTDEVAATSAEETSVPETPVAESEKHHVEFPYQDVLSLAKESEKEVRPFTAFIEEFRLAEEQARRHVSLPETSVEALSLLAPTENDFSAPVQDEETQETTTPVEEAAGPVEETTAEIVLEQFVVETAEAPLVPTDASAEVAVPAQETTTDAEAKVAESPAAESGEAGEATSEVQPASSETVSSEPPADEKSVPTPPSPERAVSPLLRPASRGRTPRHARHQREEAASEPVAKAEEVQSAIQDQQPSTQAPQVEKTEAEKAEVEKPETEKAEQPPRPPRRYRFDRPASSNTATTAASSTRVEENKEVLSRTASAARAETSNGTVGQPAEATARTSGAAQPVEQSVSKQQTQEPAAQETAPAVPENGRRRGHDRQKENAAFASTTPAVEPVNPVVEPAPMQLEEIAPEDLPPLEYAELQKTTSRRRRRHRSSSSSASAPAAAENVATPAAPAAPSSNTNTPAPGGAPSAPAASQSANGAAASSPNYSIVSGYTVSQMNQGNDLTGPFMGPDPSPARGSVLSRDGRTINRAETHRTPTPLYPGRSHTQEGGLTTAAFNQLTNSLVQALQNQTDRMVAELRRSNAAPTNVSVSLPPFPSTERVGVFVDVANLLYSARTLRISVDFGKLLDFLRGNRRLVRAHAYCPTSPQAGDEQMFLQAVKGLGYRITTKNYKTFSSGAKKADLDLDLCMDVVRLVDGRAVDCIVLVSGDSDFMPMLDYCSDHGVRVEVAAFDEAMSATLRQSCDLFINLSMLEEIRS